MSDKSILERKLASARIVKWKYIHEGNLERVRACNDIIKNLTLRLKFLNNLAKHRKEKVLFT